MMSNQISTQTISFNNQSLITVEQNGNHYVAMKPICENIGLAWEPQVLRIKRDEVLSQGMIVMIIPTNGGNQNMICLPIEYLNGWLFGIDINRCKPEIRDTLIKYKKECYQALHDYWFNGKAERKTTVDDRTGLRNAVNMLVSKKGLIYSDAYHLVHQRFNVESIEDLTLEQLPQAVEYVHRIVLEGELIIEKVKDPGINLNLSERELKDLINTWMAFTRFSDSVGFLLRKIQPIIHGSLYSSPEFNLRWCNKVIHDTQPIIKKLLDRLPAAQLLHNSRAQIKQRCEM
jgi:putative antirepressor protein|nr:MAG TPA: repressor domain protein [Caudoviricetes sp.]